MAIRVNAQGKTFTFPDGTSQADIGAAVDDFFSTQQQVPQGIARDLSPEQNQALAESQARITENTAEIGRLKQANIPTQTEALGLGFLKGTGDVGRFVKKGFLKLTGDEQGLENLEATKIGSNLAFEQLKKDRPIAITGEIAGQTALTLPVGGAAGGIVKQVGGRAIAPLAARAGIQSGGKLATAAGLGTTGALEGAAISTVLEEDEATGAAIGAGASLLMPAVLRQTSRAFKSLLGRAPKSTVFDEAGNITAAAKDEIKQAGIPFETFSDEISEGLKKEFAENTDLAAQVRQTQLEEFVPGATARPSKLAQDFATQGAEEQLIAAGTPIGQQLVAGEQRIQQGLLDAAQKNLLGDIESNLISKFETPSDDAIKALSGRSVKEAVESVRKADKAAVSNLYNAARDLAGNGAKVDGSDLKEVFINQANDLAPDENLVKATGRALKEFGVFAGDEALDGSFALPATKSIKDLNLDNAEKLRQRLNALSPTAPTDQKFLGEIKSALDSQVDNVISQFPENSAAASQFKNARAASADYFENFKNKDFIQTVIENKAGSTTAKIADEQVIERLLGTKDLSQIKKLKSILLEQPNAASRGAWNDIQFSAIDDILRRSMTPNTGELSGAKLTTVMKNYGDEKLKLLLGKDKFSQLKRFEQVAKDQTIPLIRAANASGTAGVLTEKQGAVFAPIINLFKQAGDLQTGGLVTEAAKKGEQRAAIKQAAKVVDSSLQQTKRARKVKQNKAVADYISSLLVPATVVGAQNDSN